jgi:3-hydroxyisobutyrate dehydrogenase-like beta-hydroxyacid dehydrogenase
MQQHAAACSSMQQHAAACSSMRTSASPAHRRLHPCCRSSHGAQVVERDFTPGFMIEHMAKDLGIALTEAERLGLTLPGLSRARALYDALLRHGHARDGTQALILAIEDAAMQNAERSG